MAARNDYKCLKCGHIQEAIGTPTSQCEACSACEWAIVFMSMPQYRTKYASTVEHVIAQNRKQMALVREEDSTPGTQGYKDLDEIRRECEG